jgi:tetratricopeptide (TPR) repeat protein
LNFYGFSGYLCFGQRQLTYTMKPMRTDRLELTGMSLSAANAAKLESKLIKDPEDIVSRTKLLGYYARHRNKSKVVRQARQKHILWLVRHHPHISLPGSALFFLSLDQRLDGPVYKQAKALWMSQVKANPKNLAIIGNAAECLFLFDKSTARKLFIRGQTLEPKNPKWSKQLGLLYKLNGDHAKALAEFEKARAKSGSRVAEFHLLDDLARSAFDAGNMEKARSYAVELLQQAKRRRKDWNYGNAILHGNLVLGRIALRQRKTNDAKKYLLEAGKTPGSPQLNSFGPKMTLAKDLLEKGETQAVLDYFNACAKFWRMRQNRLKSWTALVKKGQIPDFDANLLH